MPAAERDLPTVTAQPWSKVSDQDLQLVDATFDRQGNLLFVEVLGLGNFKDAGNLTGYDADGSHPQVIIDADNGFLIDDLEFDATSSFTRQRIPDALFIEALPNGRGLDPRWTVVGLLGNAEGHHSHPCLAKGVSL